MIEQPFLTLYETAMLLFVMLVIIWMLLAKNKEFEEMIKE